MSDGVQSSCSFAGGKNDPSDRDVVATALREAKEELGITVATECVWGTLKPVKDSVRLVPLHVFFKSFSPQRREGCNWRRSRGGKEENSLSFSPSSLR